MPARLALIAVQVVLLVTYVVGVGLLSSNSHDFVAASLDRQARAYAVAHPLSVPSIEVMRTGSASVARLADGWYRPDPNGVWTSAHAWLYVTVAPAGESARLMLNGQAFLPLAGGTLTISVLVDGKPITSSTASSAAPSLTIGLSIPADAAVHGIELDVDGATSPRDAAQGGDPRLRGFHLQEVVLTSATPNG